LLAAVASIVWGWEWEGMGILKAIPAHLYPKLVKIKGNEMKTKSYFQTISLWPGCTLNYTVLL